MNNIFIPKEIHVGFQERNGTYTGKLAYVVYKDEKGKLRKETSWNSWRNKDIDVLISDNVPTEGFVLNKKAGGYSTGWNHRQTYTRIYDPRGFEFEITVENLLYILENTNSIKGKGLEGEFVYGWNGKDLILIPTSSPDYKELTELNKLIHANKSIKAKDLKIGATYITKQNEEWIYMGKFDEYKYEYKYIYKNEHSEPVYYKDKSKHFFATTMNNYWTKEPYISFETISSPSGKIVGVLDESCVHNYSELYELLETKPDYCPIDYSKTEFINYSDEYIKEKLKDKNDYRWNREFNCYIKHNDEVIKVYIYWTSKKYEHTNIEKSYKIIVSSSIYNGEEVYGTFENVEDLLNKFTPMYRKLYLENGNLYKIDGGETNEQ